MSLRLSSLIKRLTFSKEHAFSIQKRFLSDINFDNLIFTPTNSPKPKPLENDPLVFGQTMSDHMMVVNWDSQQGWGAPEIMANQSFSIDPASSVLHYGLGCFEGMKAYRCVDNHIHMFRPIQNMERLYKSSVRLSLPAFDTKELLKCVAELIRIEKDWIPAAVNSSLYIRPTIISSEPSLGVKSAESAMLFVVTGPVGPYFASGTFNPISLLADPTFVRAWPGGIGDIKAGGNYAPTIYAQRIAATKGCSQCLWLFNDEVTEAGTMNVFMYWINENGEEELITPPLNGLILPGITRKSLLELAREWGEFKVSEKSFSIQQMIKAAREGRIKEVFGAGTACVVSPIDKVLYQDEFVQVDTPEGYPLAERFHKELGDIQYARKPHRWNYLVDDTASKMKSSEQKPLQ